LLKGLWAQEADSGKMPPGAALNVSANDAGSRVPTPAFPALDGTATALPGVGGVGVSMGLVIQGLNSSDLSKLAIFSTADAQGVGMTLSVGSGSSPNVGLTLRVADGATAFNMSTDKACSAALATAGPHFFGAVLDGGPNIATMMVDGVLCDGSGEVDTGWAWFPPLAASLRGEKTMSIAAPVPNSPFKVHSASWWTRMLTTSELVGLYRHLTPTSRQET
jgi:hypothetical protein